MPLGDGIGFIQSVLTEDGWVEFGLVERSRVYKQS